MSVISDASRREALIRRIIERDGEECFYCGVTFDLQQTLGFQRTLDHYMPRHLGGKNHYSNLRLACFFCNHHKGDMAPVEFFASEVLTERRARVVKLERKARGLHPRREGYWHPPKSIYRVKQGHLGCRECGAMGSPEEHLDLFPCLIYRP